MSEITNTATIRVVADASGVEAGLRPAVEAARRTEAAVAQVGAGAATSARNVDAAQRNIIASIQRTTVAMESGGRTTAAYYEAMARQRGVDPNALAPYIAQLRAVEQAQARTANSANTGAAAMGHVGLSAAQINQELRFLPNRFQAIADSITAGQRPMTIAIQQGGELVTMFGGAGAAARAIGGYLLGLVNPLTVTAVAVGTLTVAYAQGAEEAHKYTAALITSGNAAGTSADKLTAMAQHISSSIGTQGAAAEALTALVATGKVSADNLESFGAVAIRAQRALGQSVTDTASQFADLAKSPVAALEKLNDQYHFLNSTVYEHVRTLLEQGRNYDAAQAAQTAWANAFDGVTVKVDKNLGTMQRGWRGVADFAKGAWDAMLNVGREDTLEEQLTKVRKSIEKASKPFDAAVGGNAEDRVNLKANKELEASLERQIEARDRDAKLQADKTRLDAADLEWSKIKLSNLSRQKQLENELETVRNKGLEDGRSDIEINTELTKVRQKYADIYNAGVDSNIAALKRRDQVADVLEQRELARIAAQRAAGSMSEDDSINATAKAELAAFDRKRALLESELALTKKKANSVKEQADLEGQIDVLDQQRKSRAIQLTLDLAAAEMTRARANEELYTKGLVAATAERNSLVDQVKAQFDYNQEIGLSVAQVAELRAARLNNAAALKDETAASLEALDPGSQLAKTYREQAQAMRDLGEAQVRGAYKEQMTMQWKQAVDQYGQVFQQGFADMLNNGRAGWSSFTHSLVTTFKTSVADQIYKMFMRPLVVQMVGSFMGVGQQAIAGEIASGSGTAVGGGSSLIGSAQSAASLYSAFSGGLNGTLGSAITSAGNLFGSSAVSAFGSGLANGAAVGDAASAYAAAGNTTVASSLNAGASIAPAIPIIAATVASYFIAKGIAGQYKVEGVGTALNYLGIAGGLINRAFGMGDKNVTDQGVRGTLSASSLTGSNYADWHQDGGWFRSDKNGTDTKALTDAMVKQFTQGLGAIESASTGFASALGLQADWIKDYSKTFDLRLTGDATKDQQAITDFFQGIGDEIAGKLVPNLNDFAKSGEALSATLQRLAGDFQGTDKVAQLLGFSADRLFGSAGLDSAKAREQLIDMAGGLQVLSQYASSFNQNFLTDAEKLAPVAAALDKALASLGLSTIPTTRDEFKGLVNDLITSGAAATESGAKQLDSLLALGEAFAQVHPAADAAAEAVDKAAQALQAMKDSASTLLGNVDSSYSVLEKVVGREKAAVQTSVDAHSAAVSKLQSLSQALHSTLDSIKSPDQKLAERALGQAQIQAALAIAKAGGPLPDADALKGALAAVQQDASSQFGSSQDYLRDLYQTQNSIAQLGDVTDSQLSVEQQALQSAQDQLKALDGILSNAQDQIDVLKGVDTNGLTLVQAMQALTDAIVGAKGNPIVGATSAINGAYQQYLGRAPDAQGLQWWQNAAASGTGVSDIVSGIAGSTEATLNTLYKQVLGRAPDAEGLQFWMNAYGPTMDAAEQADWTKAAQEELMKKKAIPGYVAGGQFGGGLRIVGEGGPELEATGPSRIWNSNQTASLLARASSGNSDALAAEIKALRETNANQQGVIEEMAQNMAVMADTLRSVAPGGFIRTKAV